VVEDVLREALDEHRVALDDDRGPETERVAGLHVLDPQSDCGIRRPVDRKRPVVTVTVTVGVDEFDAAVVFEAATDRPHARLNH